MLRLVTDESFTIESIQTDQELGRKFRPIPKAHPGSGKESNHSFAFSAVAWGKVTRSWGKNAYLHVNHPSKIKKIFDEAKVFERAAFRRLPAGESGSDDDERVFLSEAPDSDLDEVHFHLFVCPSCD